MKARWMTCVLLWVFAAAPLSAQDSKHEVFGGFSATSEASLFRYFADTMAYNSYTNNLFRMVPGWQASYSFNVNENLSAVADFGGHYQTEYSGQFESGGTITSEGIKATERSHEFLFGPRFNGRTGMGTGFVHYLAGVRNSTREVVDLDNPGSTLAFEESGTNFAHAVGGGLDVVATDNITIRVVQVDLLMERIPEIRRDSGGGNFSIEPATWYNNVRFAFGAVFGF